MTAKHLLLIDSSGFAYRAYHGGSRFPTYRSDGMPTGTILGFLEMIWRLLGQAGADPVSHAAAVFDHPAKTFRHQIFPDYKANRGEREPELSVQLPVMREAARALGLMPVEVEGFEADDVIATLARLGVEAGLRVTIVSSDKDFGQCVRDGYVEIVDHKTNKRIMAKDVAEKFGVPPNLVTAVQAIAGDPVDNIIGVPGIGIDTAAKLVRKLGSLDLVLREAKKDSGYRMTATQKLGIKSRIKEIQRNLRLVTLHDTVDLPVILKDLEVIPTDPRHLKELLRALEAEKRFAQLFERRGPAPLIETVDSTNLALDWHTKALIESLKKAKSSLHKITLEAPDTPQAGWYKRRLVKDGPWVPAIIWRERAVDFMTDRPGRQDNLMCKVGDAMKSPSDQWGILLNNPISKADYDHMVKYRAWVKTYGAPGEPEKDEGKPVDWDKIPI